MTGQNNDSLPEPIHVAGWTWTSPGGWIVARRYRPGDWSLTEDHHSPSDSLLALLDAFRDLLNTNAGLTTAYHEVTRPPPTLDELRAGIVDEIIAPECGEAIDAADADDLALERWDEFDGWMPAKGAIPARWRDGRHFGWRIVRVRTLADRLRELTANGGPVRGLAEVKIIREAADALDEGGVQ